MPLVLKPGPADAVPFSFSPSPPASAADEHGAGATGDAAEGSAPRPPADFLQERDMQMLGALPLAGRGELGRGLVRCAKCHRPTMESSWVEHEREWCRAP